MQGAVGGEAVAPLIPAGTEQAQHAAVIDAAQRLVMQISGQQRETCDISNLTMAIKCGGSDTTSGMASNCVIGYVADKLVDLGATVVFGETTEFLYQSGAKAVHIRPACPPLLFGCKYLNFSRSNSELDLITRRIIRDREGDNVSPELLDDYANPDSQNYKEMVEEIRKRLNFTSLQFHRLDDLIESIGLEPCKLCTYCWNGKE